MTWLPVWTISSLLLLLSNKRLAEDPECILITLGHCYRNFVIFVTVIMKGSSALCPDNCLHYSLTLLLYEINYSFVPLQYYIHFSKNVLIMQKIMEL